MRVGTVGRAHGLNGAVYVEAPCGWFGFGPGSRVEVGGQARLITQRTGTDNRPILLLDGIGDRTAADELRNQAIEVGAEALPEPEPDAFYRFDLIGCDAFQGDCKLGKIAAVEDGVAHDVLVLDSGLRVPFVTALVPVVDVPGRRLEIAADVLLADA